MLTLPVSTHGLGVFDFHIGTYGTFVIICAVRDQVLIPIARVRKSLSSKIKCPMECPINVHREHLDVIPTFLAIWKRANIRSCRFVNSVFMISEIFCSCKSLSTILTMIGSMSCVDSLISVQRTDQSLRQSLE